MRTRLIKIRRRRPSGVIWAVSLMLAALAFYLITSAPKAVRMLTVQEDKSPSPAQAASTRVTKEIVFPAVRDYLIQFGAFMDPENARIEAGRYTKRGAAGYIFYEGGMYRVIGSEYGLREEAEAVKEKLKEQEGMDCQITAIGSEDATLRVTATEAQLNALVGANDALRLTLDDLRALAYRVDGGEVSKDDALLKMETYRTRIESARQTLLEQAGETPNEVAHGLLELLQKLQEKIIQIVESSTDSMLAFSGKIKYCAIEMRIELIDFLKGLI